MQLIMAGGMTPPLRFCAQYVIPVYARAAIDYERVDEIPVYMRRRNSRRGGVIPPNPVNAISIASRPIPVDAISIPIRSIPVYAIDHGGRDDPAPTDFGAICNSRIRA